MAFAVMNVVSATHDDFPKLMASLALMDLKTLEAQPGFRATRVYQAEEGTEAVMITEWDSREDFMAYRQSTAGREAVAAALPWHPRISFYEIIAGV